MADKAVAAELGAEVLARAETELQLLLEEYRTLRTEILQRISSRTQLLGFLGASVALVVGVGDRQGAYAFGATVAVILAAYWWRAALLLRRAARHVVTIEVRVNQLASSIYGVESRILTFHSDHLPRWVSGRPRRSVSL